MTSSALSRNVARLSVGATGTAEQVLRAAHPGGAQGRTGSRAGGDAVIDYDRRTAGDVDALAAAQIAAPPLDLSKFAVADGCKFGFVDAREPNQSSLRTMIGVPPSTMAPMASSGWHGTPILRTRIKSSGAWSAAATWAATGRQRQDHRLLILICCERFSQLATGIGAIPE